MGGRWTVRDGDGTEDLFVVEASGDGTLSLHIPSPDPVVITREKAQQIRLIIGVAIGETEQP